MNSNRLPLMLFLAGAMMFLPAKWMTAPAKQGGDALSPPSSPVLQSIVAGPCRGLASDYDILRVFTLFDTILHPRGNSDDDTTYTFLLRYLILAQKLDPWFFDIYRLTTGVAGFTPGLQEKAVRILRTGSEYRDWDFELPFVAGFIAHDQLHDDKLAFILMNEAAHRPGAPPMLVRLAARFLENTTGRQASIRFLQQMLESMPKDYRGPIRERLEELRKPQHQGSRQ